MNREQIENKSREITTKYLYMINEMSLTKATSKTFSNANISGFYYIKINEISNRWLTSEQPIWDIMSNMFIGLHSVNVPVSIVFDSDGSKIGVYVGCSDRYIDILDGMLKGIFSQIEYESNASGNTTIFTYSNISSDNKFGGYIKGNPTGRENFLSVYQIDSIIKGMAKTPWNISIFANPIGKTDTVKRQQFWLSVASECSELSQVAYNESDNLESISYNKSFYHSEQYTKKVEAFCDKLVESTSIGEWCVSVNFSSCSEDKSRLLGGLLTSAFYGEESEPEPIHAMYCEDSFKLICDGMEITHNSFFEQIPYPKFATYLSSKELAVLSAFPTIDTNGFSVKEFVEFDVNRKSDGDLCIGNILDSGNITNSTYNIDSNEFNRHCLVVGLTGSGKTNTVKSLICGLTKGTTRPIMVIEPAKKEYWELYKLGYSDLQIYSVGSNEKNAHTFCINPFERAAFIDSNGVSKSVPIQTHIDFVYSAFKASFIMYTPMPYVLERAIYSIYEDCGWDIHNNVNTTGKEIYPTIEDLYFKIPEVVTDMGYDTKMRNDLIGSLQARVNSMRLGTKGDALNVERSFSLDKLLKGNVVIELEDIGDDDVKAFIISLLLVNLLEYRRQQEDCQLEIRHLVLIEEAHRLLKNVQSGSGENADPRGAAVEFFCNLLAELRSKGQGFIVADQIPSKLAPDLIKNTNLKIVHRTVAEEERLLIGGAMHMTEAQIDSLASFKQGVAAVYSEGDNRPKLVKPAYAGNFTLAERKSLSREQVLDATAANCIQTGGRTEYQSLTNWKPVLCRTCNPHCRKRYTDILSRIDDINEFNKIADWSNPNKTGTCTVQLVKECVDNLYDHHIIDSLNFKEDKHCLLGCLIDRWDIDEKLKNKLISAYNNSLGGVK